ncbi:MAG TPA: ABC transporter permease, partial [Bacteroidales bacterium]|nr:ABC transporter permease [Bacteroidales bacterium]
FILQKEFRQVFRDKLMLPIIFIVPVVQLLILSYTATFEIKNTRIVIVDLDHSQRSRELVFHFESSSFFKIVSRQQNYQLASEWLKNGDADQVIVIGADFEKAIEANQSAKILLVTDAINGSAASLMNAYAQQVIQGFNKNILTEKMPFTTNKGTLSAEPLFWYNPKLNYVTYMVPGILVLLVTIIGFFLSGMNIVKEKEMGTIEQINVTPIKKWQFITGKLLPFWLIALFELVFGLGIAKLVFDIPFLGSFPLLMGVAAVYLLVILAMGLLVSTLSDTMQQSMFISWFFLVIFILMSGLFTPIESMPAWAQWFNKINPIAYFITINRMIMLKGSDFFDFSELFYALSGYAVVMLLLAVNRYKKVKA